MKTYKKAKVLAKNNPKGSYAAGCPPKDAPYDCKGCERTR